MVLWLTCREVLSKLLLVPWSVYVLVVLPVRTPGSLLTQVSSLPRLLTHDHLSVLQKPVCTCCWRDTAPHRAGAPFLELGLPPVSIPQACSALLPDTARHLSFRGTFLKFLKMFQFLRSRSPVIANKIYFYIIVSLLYQTSKQLTSSLTLTASQISGLSPSFLGSRGKRVVTCEPSKSLSLHV